MSITSASTFAETRCKVRLWNYEGVEMDRHRDSHAYTALHRRRAIIARIRMGETHAAERGVAMVRPTPLGWIVIMATVVVAVALVKTLVG